MQIFSPIEKSRTGKPKALGFHNEAFLAKHHRDAQGFDLKTSGSQGHRCNCADPPVSSHAGSQLSMVRNKISYQFLCTVVHRPFLYNHFHHKKHEYYEMTKQADVWLSHFPSSDIINMSVTGGSRLHKMRKEHNSD